MKLEGWVAIVTGWSRGVARQSPRLLRWRLARLEEMSKAALFLASNESDYVTGEILRVDGGWVPYGEWEFF